MRNVALAAMVFTLTACATPTGGETAVPANDHTQPLLALVDHLLGNYFASDNYDGITVCAATTDGRELVALPFEQESILMARHISLNPMSSCGLIDGAWQNVDADAPALVFQVHSFTCTDADHCSGFGGSTRGNTASISSLYKMTWSNGEWQFVRDDRLLGDK